jgi:hypothetical protein
MFGPFEAEAKERNTKTCAPGLATFKLVAGETCDM